MGSSEIVDSARRSNFSQTCNLLSQYLKEKGSFGDLTLGLTPTAETKETMNLLPMIEKKSSQPPKEETAPLTIFYAGQVLVFNDFPADKANEILALVSKSGAESATSVPNTVAPRFASARPSLDSDLPIARKNSLTRFLEKRRDRITANAPYPAAKPEAWLGLAPQIPFQIQRN